MREKEEVNFAGTKLKSTCNCGIPSKSSCFNVNLFDNKSSKPDRGNCGILTREYTKGEIEGLFSNQEYGNAALC